MAVLELNKKSSAKEFQNLTDQIRVMGKRLESIHLDCQNEITQMHQLYQKRMKLEAPIRQFENDNEAYNKIRKTAEEKVHNILSDRKELLRCAIFYVIESIGYGFLRYKPNSIINYGSIGKQIKLH